MTVNSSSENINYAVYATAEVAQRYESMDGLFPAERVVLENVADRCRNRKILDLGVGAGRTTKHMLAISRDYLGVDYSKEMIATARKHHPGVTFAVGDARDLYTLETGAFALVLFSFNGLDYVDHEDRQRILREINRILEEGGVFVFSTHNARYDRRRHQPIAKRMLGRGIDFVRSAWSNYKWLSDVDDREHLRVIPSFGHKHVLLTYYISRRDQVEQLRVFGFECELVVAENGLCLDQEMEYVSPWIYYVATKRSSKVGGAESQPSSISEP